MHTLRERYNFSYKNTATGGEICYKKKTTSYQIKECLFHSFRIWHLVESIPKKKRNILSFPLLFYEAFSIEINKQTRHHHKTMDRHETIVLMRSIWLLPDRK